MYRQNVTSKPYICKSSVVSIVPKDSIQCRFYLYHCRFACLPFRYRNEINSFYIKNLKFFHGK